MKTVFITGSSGFLGRYVVQAALDQGYRVKAVVRPASDASKLAWFDHPQVELVRLDLRQGKGIAEALAHVDWVIHLAAVKGGDSYDRFAGTVITTENLLRAMVECNLRQMVFVSTFSVYDYRQMRTGRLLDEGAPVEANPQDRDEYAQTKLIQERLVRTFEQEQSAQVAILRPGMIYEREDLWHVLLGEQFGSTWLAIGPGAFMPMIYVENCAEAIVAAVDCNPAMGQTLNLVDDPIPKRSRFFKALIQQTGEKPRIINFPWPLMRFISSLAMFVNNTFCGGNAKMPGILVPAKLEARFKPPRYTNQRAKELLGWAPRYSLEEAIDRSSPFQA